MNLNDAIPTIEALEV
jgi:hypothetical protein